MSRLPLAAILLALPAVAITSTPRAARAQVVAVAGTPDSVAMDAALVRARRQAADGDLAGARLVLDSLASAAEPGSRRLAEVLFWRATYAQTAAGAERDYRRIVIEHPLSPRTEDALMRLAQLELARGDQQMAVRHLERLVLEHPESPNRARARYWTARAWMDAGDVTKGCAALGEALVSSGGTDVELRNQVRYAGQRCPKGWDATSAGATTSVAANAPAAAPASVSTPPASVVAAGAESTSVVRADSARQAPAVEPPRQGMKPAPRESVTTPSASAPRASAPAAMPPFLGASPTSTSTSTASSTASPRVDSSAGRGAPPRSNVAPPTQPAVTTSAPPASPTRPAVFVPPLAKPPAGVGTSAVAGSSAPRTTTTSAPAPVRTPTPANTPASAPASAPPLSSARPGAGAPAPARRTIYTVQLAAYDTRPDAESLVRRLASRGIDARVSGDVAPFRVRVGRHAVRADAVKHLAALKAKGHAGFVAEEAAPAGDGDAR